MQTSSRHPHQGVHIALLLAAIINPEIPGLATLLLRHRQLHFNLRNFHNYPSGDRFSESLGIGGCNHKSIPRTR